MAENNIRRDNQEWLDREENDFILQQEEVESVKWFVFEEYCELIRNNQISHCVYVEEMEMLANYIHATGKLHDELQKIGEEAGQEESQIALAAIADLDRILEIYDIAKQYMRDSGNPNQWNGAYPDRETLMSDIEKQQLYVWKQQGTIHAVFVLLLEEEPTYAYIEGPGWLNDEPYGTIHRIAGDGTVKGVFERCMEFCKEKVRNIRIDTHHDNHTMQHLAEKYGFQKCGIIYLKNGNPRIAYHYMNKMMN